MSGVQRLNVSAKVAPRSFYIARDDERAFTWTSTYSAATGNEVLYVKNDDTDRNLIIHDIVVGGANAGVYTVAQVTGTGSGTTVTPKNLNLSSGRTADATSLGNASVTGLTIGDTISIRRVAAGDNTEFKDIAESLILGFGDAIAITYVGSTGNVECIVHGYFEDAGTR